MQRSLVLLVALMATFTAPTVAQTCLGLASYSDRPLQVIGNGWLTNEARSVGAGLGFGLRTGAFGNLAIGTISNQAIGGSSIELGASSGYQIPLGKAGRSQLCPVARLGLGIGPNNAFHSGVDRSNRSASVGLALGRSFLANPRLTLIPTVALAYAYRQDQAEDPAGATLFEIKNDYARLELGIGLVLNSNLSVRPGADIPLGLVGGEPTIGIVVGYTFGIPRRTVAGR